MTETQIKKEVLKIIGQEDLKAYFDYSNAETRESIIDSIFDCLCITEDDIEEQELTQHQEECNEFDATFDKYER